MPNFIEIGPLVPGRRFLKGFYHIWAWWPSWSCGLDYLYIHWLPLPIDASQKILALICPMVLEEKTIDYYGDIHVYCPGMGAHKPLGPFFLNH